MDCPGPSEACNTCPARMVCRCLGVTEAALFEAIAQNKVKTIKDISRHTGAGDGCTACHRLLQLYLTDLVYVSSSPNFSLK